jgi:hypothetical protein
MYTQYFLKFESQAQAHEVFGGIEWYGQVAVADGEPRYDYTLPAHSGALDEVGLVVDVPATYDEVTFEELTPTTYVDGWHINIVIKIPLPDALAPHLVSPTSPQRVFAGFSV